MSNPQPVTLTVGGMTVDQLLAFHRARFGDSRMDASDGESEPEAPAAPEAPKPAPPAADKAPEKDWAAEAEKWKALARKHEDQSKANADKARRYDEFEESQKTEQQKLEERAKAAEAKAAEIELRALKAEVANEKGVPANLLTGTTAEELAAAADALLAFRGEKKLPDLGGGDRGVDVSTKTKPLNLEEAVAARLASQSQK